MNLHGVIMANTSLKNNQIVDNLQKIIRHGGNKLDLLPGYVIMLIEGDAWKQHQIYCGKEYKFGSFADFVTENPPAGLGSNLATLRRYINASDKPEAIKALNLFDDVTKKGDGNPTGSNQYSKDGGERGTVDTINSSSNRPTGTTRQAALRRLKKDRPDMHKRVLSGELSANKAMIEAGFRKQRFSSARDPEALAAKIKKEFTREEIDTIKNILSEEK